MPVSVTYAVVLPAEENKPPAVELSAGNVWLFGLAPAAKVALDTLSKIELTTGEMPDCNTPHVAPASVERYTVTAVTPAGGLGSKMLIPVVVGGFGGVSAMAGLARVE